MHVEYSAAVPATQTPSLLVQAIKELSGRGDWIVFQPLSAMAPLISGESFPWMCRTLRGVPLLHEARLTHFPSDTNHKRLMRSASSPSNTPFFIC